MIDGPLFFPLFARQGSRLFPGGDANVLPAPNDLHHAPKFLLCKHSFSFLSRRRRQAYTLFPTEGSPRSCHRNPAKQRCRHPDPASNGSCCSKYSLCRREKTSFPPHGRPMRRRACLHIIEMHHIFVARRDPESSTTARQKSRDSLLPQRTGDWRPCLQTSGQESSRLVVVCPRLPALGFAGAKPSAVWMRGCKMINISQLYANDVTWQDTHNNHHLSLPST